MSDTNNLTATAPKNIWLEVSDDLYDLENDFPDREDITWSEDGSLTCAVEYVRRDIHEAELAAANAKIENLAADEKLLRQQTLGKLGKLKYRIGAGVCPCCNRKVSQLAAHIKTKHPGYGSDPTKEGAK